MNDMKLSIDNLLTRPPSHAQSTVVPGHHSHNISRLMTKVDDNSTLNSQ